MGHKSEWIAAWVTLVVLWASGPAARAQDAPVDGRAGPPQATSQDLQVVDGADDAEEGPSGVVRLSSSDLELVYDEARPMSGDQTVAIRFRGVEVPRDAAVSLAYVQFTCKDASEEACSLTIQGEAIADASVFKEETGNVSSRARTRAAVQWSPDPWKEGAAGPAERTPDLSPVIHEIVSRPGWVPGNALAVLITGKGMRRAHSYDGRGKDAARLHVEWHVERQAQRPPEDDTQAVPEAPASGPAATPAPGAENTSAVVNTLFDNIVEGGSRLLELPLFMLLAGLGVSAAALILAAGLLCRKGKHPRLRRAISGVVAALFVLTVAYTVDRKIVRLQGEVSELRSSMNANTAALLDAIARQHEKRSSLLFDLKDAETRLTGQLGPVKVKPLIYDEATDIVQVIRTDPVAHAFLAVIDLRHPSLEIRLGTNVTEKSLTSEFARENDCTVAVNGEAGASSKPDSGFGDWIGNLVYRGRAVLLEDTAKRPFLSFDRGNRAAYSPAAVVDRELTPDKYNVIWGRLDALVGGEEVTADWRSRQPRTAMAIDQDGTRLYLLVVDGRQPNYSMGFTRAEVGQFLKAFGAHDGMLCDEGGSSCFYVRDFGGITDVPSDRRGQERPTYTHFGVTFRKSDEPRP